MYSFWRFHIEETPIIIMLGSYQASTKNGSKLCIRNFLYMWYRMIRGLLDPPLTKSIRVISYYFTILFNWKNIESFYTIGMYLIISNHIYGVHIYIYIYF